MGCNLSWYQISERILRLINRRRIPWSVLSTHYTITHSPPSPPLCCGLRMSHILGGSLITLSSIWPIITKGINAMLMRLLHHLLRRVCVFSWSLSSLTAPVLPGLCLITSSHLTPGGPGVLAITPCNLWVSPGPAHHFLLSDQRPAVASLGCPWLGHRHPSSQSSPPTFQISQRHLLQEINNCRWNIHTLFILFSNISIAHCELKSVEVFEVLLDPGLDQGPSVGPDHGEAGLGGLGPGQAWCWASARCRVTTPSWSAAVSALTRRSLDCELWNEKRFAIIAISYIDQGLRLVLHTAGLVAENINLVIYEQLVPLKLDSRLGVSFTNLKYSFQDNSEVGNLLLLQNEWVLLYVLEPS